MRNQSRLNVTISLFFIFNFFCVLGQDNPDPEKIGGKYYFITSPVFDTVDKKMKKVTEDSATTATKEQPADVPIQLGHKIRITDSHSGRIYFKYLMG